MRLETEHVSASGDLAYSTGRYQFTVAGARHEGKYLVVFRRTADGRYQSIADSFSDNA